MSVPTPNVIEVGSVLRNRYKVVQLLGRGGMGSVFLCHDLQDEGARWAVKQMAADEGKDAELMKESFRREARFLTELRHPGMPFVVDVLEEPPYQYLVMEYVDGLTLLDKVETEGRPDDGKVLDWGVELCEVLDYLHNQTPPIIFRDLKPENVMCAEGEHLKVIDFGMARHFRSSKRRDTQTGGTIGYTAPEQWDDFEQSDARSDIFSLGATLYFLLTGHPPGAIYNQIDLRKHRADVNEELEALVLRCMAIKPQARFQTAAQVREELMRLGGHSRQPQDLRVEQREPRTLLSSLPRLAFVCLIGVLLLGAASWRASQHSRETLPSISASPLANSRAPISKSFYRELLEAGDYAQLEQELDELLVAHPLDAEAYIMRNNARALKSAKPLYRIPVISSWQGDEGEGLDALFGWGFAQSHLNESRHDQPLIYLELFNDNSRADQLLGIVKELMSDPAVPLVVGPWSSQQALLIAPLVNKSRLPVITPVASDPRVLSSGPDIFCVADTDVNKARAVAEHFYSTGCRRATVLADESRYVSRTMADLFSESFQELGGEVVVQEAYSHTQMDFGSLLKKAQAGESDCVFLAEYRATPVLQVCTVMRETKWDVPVASQLAGFAGQFVAGAERAEGLLLSTTFVPELMGVKQREFQTRFESEFVGHRLTHREAQVYDSLTLAVDALDTVGPDRTKLSEYLTSLGREKEQYSGISGDFAPSKHMNSRPAFLLTIENERYKPLKK